ncbi:TM2 domain-containing protein [Cupriavidus necator]|uniref:TM2 domain-containing protein n=1 Tax=Cupriavidus necator TaxID=106590 RepID=UPI0005B4D6F9|nr:TM2 domain-containing protein [Cupriavidus necator]
MNDSAKEMMLYDAQKKSVGVAYALWFFLGMFGAHRFYAGSNAIGFGQMALSILGFLVPWGVGLFIFGAVSIWVLIDGVLLPGVIRDYNVRLASSLGNA